MRPGRKALAVSAPKEHPVRSLARPGTLPTSGCDANSTLGHEDLRDAKIQLFHDENAEVYFNGILAAQAAGFSVDYILTNINDQAAESLKPGLNTMAVHCHQTTGGQFIDAGIVVPQNGKSAAAKK